MEVMAATSMVIIGTRSPLVTTGSWPSHFWIVRKAMTAGLVDSRMVSFAWASARARMSSASASPAACWRAASARPRAAATACSASARIWRTRFSAWIAF